MEGTRVLFEWHRDWRDAGARAGFSLHSHTCFSREPLDFIPRCAEACPWIEPFLRRYEARYRRACGRSLDYAGAWWTPPLGPREALRVERKQIEGLGLRAEVSITDHDSIEAPLAALILLAGVPATVHLLEWRWHEAAAPAARRAGFVVSWIQSALSIATQWTLMREGLFLSGAGARSYLDDWRSLPLAVRRLLARAAGR